MSDGPVVALVAGLDSEALAECVGRAGGVPRPVVLDAATPPEDVLEGVGGLLIAAEPPSDTGGPLARLVTAATHSGMPVLGIGGGLHCLNLALGGDRAVEVPGHAPEEGATLHHHIYVAPGSRLAAIVGSGGFVRVNSAHHQGIREAQKSPLLLASAYSVDDGIIEAVESTEHDWVIGVQFRPERPRQVPPQFERLFQGLVERARAHVEA
jgi:hypothetical protein